MNDVAKHQPQDAVPTPDDAFMVVRGDDAVTVKAEATAARADFTRQTLALQKQEAEMRADIQRQEREIRAQFDEQRALLEAQMAPLKKQLEQATEVLWVADLYLGRGEDLELIREGSPAPAETPITIRQKVLVMAEESLVLMDKKLTGMDGENVEEFVEWLVADDANLDRILPERRGVVVLVPTRVEHRSGNIFEDMAKDEQNSISWWLLRNGDRLYLLTVDPKLKVGERLLPRRTEFTEVFDKRLFGFGRGSGESVRPGSEEWMKMQESSDARRRHYMRIMLVLQGIIDRTSAWSPLPEGGVNLMSLADQDAGKIVLVQDGETSIQLGDGREKFGVWQRRLNELLRPGLRLIGNWGSRGFAELASSGNGHSYGHPRLHPFTVSGRPEANVPHLIEGRKDGGVVIRFKRTDKVYKKNVPVPGRPGLVYRGEMSAEATNRASCVILPSDEWVLPYDLVTVEELEYYLNSREARSNHFLTMVPTVKAALAAKLAEAEQEAPFRVGLTGLLVNEGADVEDAPALVEELVHWWKIANTWARPLNGEPAHEAKAAKQIVTEYRARQSHASDNKTKRVVAAGRKVPGVICVARNRQGQWNAYAPSTPAHDKNVFLDATPIRVSGTLGETKQWVAVAQRTATALHVAWSTEEWAQWKFSANARHYLTGPQRDALIAEALAQVSGVPLCVTEYFDPKDPQDRSIAIYSWAADTSPEETPARITKSPLDYHDEYLADSRLIGTDVWVLNKTQGGDVSLDKQRSRERYATAFARFSGGSKWGATPWWPEDAHRYHDVRPRLAWADEDMLDRIAAYTQRCAEAWKAKQTEDDARSARAYRYSQPTMGAIRVAMEAEAKAKFVEDFGADAMDLWPAHLETLNSPEPIHPRILWGLVAIALENEHPVVGQTLDDLSDFAWEHRNEAPGEWNQGRSRIDMGKFGQIVVPAPEDEPDD